jgi:hypothetical protein
MNYCIQIHLVVLYPQLQSYETNFKLYSSMDPENSWLHFQFKIMNLKFQNPHYSKNHGNLGKTVVCFTATLVTTYNSKMNRIASFKTQIIRTQLKQRVTAKEEEGPIVSE